MRKAVIAFSILSIIILSQFARAQSDNPYLENIRKQIMASDAKVGASIQQAHAINKAATTKQLMSDIEKKNLPPPTSSFATTPRATTTLPPAQTQPPAPETFAPPPEPEAAPTTDQSLQQQNQPSAQPNIFCITPTNRATEINTITQHLSLTFFEGTRYENKDIPN